MSVLCHVLIFECSFSSVCILGGQQPAGQQSRSKDYRTAQEEQFLPLHAPVRRREQSASTIALTVSPRTGQNWTEHTLISLPSPVFLLLFLIDLCFFSSRKNKSLSLLRFASLPLTPVDLTIVASVTC